MRARRIFFLLLAILLAIVATACASPAGGPARQAEEPSLIAPPDKGPAGIASTTAATATLPAAATSAPAPRTVVPNMTEPPGTEGEEEPVPGIEMPPSKGYVDTPMPPQSARLDLADRLHTDPNLVEIVSVSSRVPDPETMPCLGDGSLSEELVANVETVGWITLSIKGNLHHYLAFGDNLFYCEK